MPDPQDLHPDTYEVIGGKHVDAEGNLLTKGGRFHPTNRQVRKGSLEGKARKVKGKTSTSATVDHDIGIRSLPWGSDTALEKALAADPVLTEEELVAVGGEDGSGSTGFITSDVDAALSAREQDEDEGGDEEDGEPEAEDGEDESKSEAEDGGEEEGDGGEE